MVNVDWLQNRITDLKGLKKPNDQQSLLIILAEKSERTPAEEKTFAALVRAEKAMLVAAKARQAASHLINSENRKTKEIERKARNHRLILQGTLIDLANLAEKSRGEILGLLLGVAAIEDPKRWADWKMKGDAFLAAMEEKNQNAKNQ